MSDLGRLILLGDLGIALAYFAIPIGMVIILRNKLKDLPYPWLIVLFAAFIVACGITHLVHALQMPWTTFEHTVPEAIAKTVCAVLSIGTAIALLVLLPQIKLLPSPAEQKEDLERRIAERTKEKDELVWQIYHQLGNQLQMMSSALNIERRRHGPPETTQTIERLDRVIRELNTRYGETLKQVDAAHVEPATRQVYAQLAVQSAKAT